jgi:DNA-binding NtrC family response regulator
VVASTDEDLPTLAGEGRFRRDLLYRLQVVTIAVPPLRERREDIPLLAEHFAAKHGRSPTVVSPTAMDLLLSHDWPGNVRELENAIARALALSSAGLVLPDNLPPAVRGAESTPAPTGAPGSRPSLAELERRYAVEILRETGGNKTRAAEILGIDRKTLYRLLGDAGTNGRPYQPGR